MTTADRPALDRRRRRRLTRADERRRDTGLDDLARERQQLLFSLQTAGCVLLTLFFLRIGVPGAAFVLLAAGVLLLGRDRPEQRRRGSQPS